MFISATTVGPQVVHSVPLSVMFGCVLYILYKVIGLKFTVFTIRPILQIFHFVKYSPLIGKSRF